MVKYKSFTPKVDLKRRLVLTRFYAGIKDSNSFSNQITRIQFFELKTLCHI